MTGLLTATAAVASIGGMVWTLYVYILYPLILWVLCGLARALSGGPRSRASERSLPTVSLIIAAYNEEIWIATKVANTLALNYPRGKLEILVVADGSTDATADIAGEASRSSDHNEDGFPVRLLFEPERRGKTHAVTRAIAQASGDIVALSDANCLLNADALQHLVGPFASPDVGVTTGAKTIEDGDGDIAYSESKYWRYEDKLKRMESCVHSTVAVVGEMMAFRRELFEIPPDGTVNDDFWVALSVLTRGYRVKYVPQALAVERVSPSAKDELQRRSRIVAGRFQAFAYAMRRLYWRRPLVAWMLTSHKFMRPLVPFAMIVALVGNAAWVLRGPSLAGVMLGLQGLGYLLAIAGASRVSLGPLDKVTRPAWQFVAANAAAIRGLVMYARGDSTSVWRRAARRGPA